MHNIAQTSTQDLISQYNNACDNGVYADAGMDMLVNEESDPDEDAAMPGSEDDEDSEQMVLCTGEEILDPGDNNITGRESWGGDPDTLVNEQNTVTQRLEDDDDSDQRVVSDKKEYKDN
jgi:hypothetical protein